MKRKTLNSLSLNKKAISNLQVTGGAVGGTSTRPTQFLTCFTCKLSCEPCPLTIEGCRVGNQGPN